MGKGNLKEAQDEHQEMCSLYDTKQEYWGPVSKDFTDAYLELLYENLRKNSILRRNKKKVFSAATEMLHNIIDYNIQHFEVDFPPSYISIELLNNITVLRFHNVVLINTVEELRYKLNELVKVKQEDYPSLCRQSLLNNSSLGLLLLNKDNDTNFHWELMKDNGKDWLKILITVNHGSTNN